MDPIEKILKSVWESKTKFDLIESFKDLDKIKALIMKDVLEKSLQQVVAALVGEKYQRKFADVQAEQLQDYMEGVSHRGCGRILAHSLDSGFSAKDWEPIFEKLPYFAFSNYIMIIFCVRYLENVKKVIAEEIATRQCRLSK